MTINIFLSIVLLNFINICTSFKILHYNDVYDITLSRNFENIIKENKHDILLFSGDTLFPSDISINSNGSHMIEYMDYLNTSYSVIGNHDLDRGINIFEEQTGKSKTIWPPSNMYKRG